MEVPKAELSWVEYYGTQQSLITVKLVEFDGRDRILWPVPADRCIATNITNKPAHPNRYQHARASRSQLFKIRCPTHCAKTHTFVKRIDAGGVFGDVFGGDG